MFFYNKIINFLKRKTGIFSEFIVFVIPIIINSILFYLFWKYRIKFDNHWFVLIGLAAIIPLAFNFASKIISVISFLLLFSWAIMIFNMDISVFDISLFAGTILKLLLVVCLCGLLFGLAEIVSLNKKLITVGNIWKALSLTLFSTTLLILTINIFDNYNYFDISIYVYNSLYAHGLFILLFLFTTLGILIYNFAHHTIINKQFHFETFTAFVFVFVPIVSYLLIDNYFVTHPPYYYTVVYDQTINILFNSIFVLFVLILLAWGYIKKKYFLIVFGCLSSIAFLCLKYLDNYLDKFTF